MSVSETFETQHSSRALPSASFTTLQLQHLVNAKLQQLPKEKLLSVLDFVDFLTQSTATRLPASLPEPTAFLECAGAWEFAPGELESILETLETIRRIDLEEQDARTAHLLA